MIDGIARNIEPVLVLWTANAIGSQLCSVGYLAVEMYTLYFIYYY